MSIAANATKEDKIEWLLKPINWAYSMSFFAAIFGTVYCFYGIYDDAKVVAYLLAATLAVNVGLLLWAISRIREATSGSRADS